MVSSYPRRQAELAKERSGAHQRMNAATLTDTYLRTLLQEQRFELRGTW